MTDLSRRKLIKTGLAATSGITALGVAAGLAKNYGLIPPDHGGVWGVGETLNYASYRLLTKHSMAREFSRSEISTRPLANEIPPPTEAFKKSRREGSRIGGSPLMEWWIDRERSRWTSSRAIRREARSLS